MDTAPPTSPATSPTSTTSAAVVVEGLSKRYGSGPTAVDALRDVSFRIDAGEFVVLLGPSGSGKTTCLNVLGAIEDATGGSVRVDGVEVTTLEASGRTAYRRDEVGFVFQFYNLVPTLTALENVQLVAETVGPDAEPRSRRALDEVGLGDRVDHFPGQLSGGEQQRVAIARALAKHPAMLLCDEPTGALDLDTGRQVLEMLRQIADEGRTVLLVTHNSVIAEMADRVLRLRDGALVGDEHQASPKTPGALAW
jgi:putative ABC transport system ATP-binding protein